MSKMIKLASLFLAGVTLIGCSKTDPEAEKAKQKAEADAARKGQVTNPTTVPASGTSLPSMEGAKEGAKNTMSSVEDTAKGAGNRAGQALEGLGKKVEGATTQP